ncbi:hypothetical protein FDUTEX481_02094 [Tolypothrix sp. PCC 7601]|nr:hypothetical protein FDUTEX481_02094 [Tolypothrix sp. PCC 7601]
MIISSVPLYQPLLTFCSLQTFYSQAIACNEQKKTQLSLSSN